MTAASWLRARALRSDDGLLQRVRWLFVTFNILLAGLTPLDLLAPNAPTGDDRIVMLLAFGAIGVWAWRYFQRGGRGILLNLAPLVLLGVGGAASGELSQVFGRLYVALFLQALYPIGRRRTVLLGIAYFSTYQVVAIAVGDAPTAPTLLTDLLSVFLVGGIMHTLAVSVTRHERLSARDGVLTEVTASLIRERDPQQIATLVTQGALRLVDAPGTMATVWRGDGTRLRRLAVAGRPDYPLKEIDLRLFPAELQEIFYEAQSAVLQPEEMRGIEDLYGLEHEFLYGAVAPLTANGKPVGVLVISSRSPIDPDLLGVLTRFAHEVSMAQELADHDALLSGIVENSADVIAVIDDSATLTYVSPMLEALAGRDPADVIGGGLGALLVHQDRDRPVDDWVFDTHAPVPLRLTTSDGHREVEVTASALEAGRSVLSIRDVSERRRLEQEVEYRAFHDTVTGLPNRSLFLDRLDQAIRRSTRAEQPVAVLMIDLDDFKTINDSYGHAAGDALLAAVGARLATATRDTDTPARLGGDEFAVLLEGVDDAAEAATIALRLLEDLRLPLTVEGREVWLSASVGIAVGDALHPDEMLRNADAAMYAAKAAGKNRFALFEPGMHEDAMRRIELRAGLETALLQDEFVVHYQPLVSMDRAPDPIGFEALLRWQHPVRGLLPPAEFIPLAEETGMIVPIGRWVLAEACRQLAVWTAEGAAGDDVYLSVNLSPIQLRSESIVADVTDALDRSGIDPARVMLEITETALLADIDQLAHVLTRLRSLGVRIAIDDFGTGYSSFTHLQRFPVDVLKVDRTFVSVVTEGVEQAALAKAIVKLATALHLETVAEGVESSEQAALLEHWGCRYGQGFLWSKAVGPNEARALLNARVRVNSDLDTAT